MRISDWSSDVCSSDLMILLAACRGIVARHILAPVARQRPRELALVGEVVTAVMELHAVAVPRQADIGAVAVHARRSEDVPAIDGDALRLVDRRRIAVINGGILLRLERDAPAPRPAERRGGDKG